MLTPDAEMGDTVNVARDSGEKFELDENSDLR